VPGQNPAAVTTTAALPVNASDIKNGNLSFIVGPTAPPPSPVPGAPECPNTGWTENITDVAFTSATITVQQPRISSTCSDQCASNVVFTLTCNFSPPTSDGLVPAASIGCP
jgi:hypothetical protein